MWFDRSDRKYKVSENYVIYLEQRYADKVEVINDFEEEQKAILRDFFKNKNGVLLTSDLREEYYKKDCQNNPELEYRKKYLKIDCLL